MVTLHPGDAPGHPRRGAAALPDLGFAPDGAQHCPAAISPDVLQEIEAEVPGTVARCGAVVCLAAAGDVWLYATPILHASDAAAAPRRRVLQVDYAVGELPGGLRWLGI